MPVEAAARPQTTISIFPTISRGCLAPSFIALLPLDPPNLCSSEPGKQKGNLPSLVSVTHLVGGSASEVCT